MTKPVYLLSDLHLPASPSPLRATFLAFLEDQARQAGAVYILGDLFEYWVGDDIGLDVYADETAALKSLGHAGVQVCFQHGNRDFLVGREFSDLTGVELLPDFHRLELGRESVLLAHGDQFCTEDRAYQRWRRFARNRAAQILFLMLPASLRERIAGGVRARSSAEKTWKAADIMDVSEVAVRSCFEDAGVDRIIHGHTHRPADHRYAVGDRTRTRTVLADWRPGQCEVLRVDSSGFQRERLASSD